MAQEKGDTIKPVRDNLSTSLDQIPSGPFDKVGKGNIATSIGYFGVSLTKTITGYIPGVKRPGYTVLSHNVEFGETEDIHIVEVYAVSRKIAEFVSKYEVAASSNIEYIQSDIQIISIEEVRRRQTYSLWEMVVEVDRGD